MRILTIACALTLVAIVAGPSHAQSRRDVYDSREKASRDLIKPKYKTDGLGDRSIRRENDSLRNRLLLDRNGRSLR